MIAFLVPGLLVLLALTAAPLIIHWLTRRRAVTRVFPPLALLLRADAGRTQASRWRDWLLLLLRVSAIAAVVLACAGTLWRGRLADPTRAAIVIVDASASMHQRIGSQRAWDRARALAAEVCTRLAPRPLSVVIADGRDGAVATPSRHAGEALAALAEAAPGWGDGGLSQVISAALTKLGADGGDIILITDRSRSALAGIDTAALPSAVRLEIAGIGAAQPAANLALTGLVAEPAVAVVGREVRIMARVGNFSPHSASVAVRLRIGSGEHLAALRLAAGESGEAVVTLTPSASGSLVVAADILREAGNSDALSEDDQRIGVLEVQNALSAVLISDRDPASRSGPIRPLSAALSAAGFQVRLLTSAAFLAESPAAPLYVTAGLRAASAAAAVRTRALAGAAWLQVITDDGDAESATSALQPPIAIGTSIDVSASGRGHVAIHQARFDHRLLSGLRGRDALLTAGRTWRYRLTPTLPAGDATVLMTWSDGTVAAAERPFGLGRWLLLNLSPAPADGDWAGRDAWPLLIGALPAHLLSERSGDLAHAVGSWIAQPTLLSDPAGRPASGDGARSRLDEPQLYRTAQGQRIAAGIPAAESDLRYPISGGTESDPSQQADRLAQAAATTPLWHWLVPLVLLLMTGELLLARRVVATPRPTGARP